MSNLGLFITSICSAAFAGSDISKELRSEKPNIELTNQGPSQQIGIQIIGKLISNGQIFQLKKTLAHLFAKNSLKIILENGIMKYFPMGSPEMSEIGTDNGRITVVTLASERSSDAPPAYPTLGPSAPKM